MLYFLLSAAGQSACISLRVSHRPQSLEVIAQTQKDGSHNMLGKWHQETCAQWLQMTRLGGFYCHRWSPAEKKEIIRQNGWRKWIHSKNGFLMFESHFCKKKKLDHIKNCKPPPPGLFFSQRLFIHIKIHKNVCKGAQNYHITQRDHFRF